MSDAGGSDASVSDGEFDGEFDDFVPPTDSDGSAGGPADGSAAADSDDEDTAEDADGAESARGKSDNPPPHKRPQRTEPPASQEAGVRRILVVAPEERLTSNTMTLAEVARAVALRARQISEFPYVYTEVGELSDPIDIAKKELYDRRSPLKLIRQVGRTAAGESIVEEWLVREMSYPS